MKLTLTSTDRLETVNGVTARVWLGTSSDGARVIALIAAIGGEKDGKRHQFPELQATTVEVPEPNEWKHPASIEVAEGTAEVMRDAAE